MYVGHMSAAQLAKFVHFFFAQGICPLLNLRSLFEMLDRKDTRVSAWVFVVTYLVSLG